MRRVRVRVCICAIEIQRTAVCRFSGSFLFPHCIVLKCCELSLLYDLADSAIPSVCREAATAETIDGAKNEKKTEMCLKGFMLF